MVLQVHNQPAQGNTTLGDITFIKGTQCDSVKCYFVTKTPASSTSMTFVKLNLIPILSYSIFIQLNINGPHLTSPHSILGT